ncbi:fumarylacetoacetase [Caulobacter soli]|uniref:fumarylacetoacetase n=1 Tax=Caulobacter soli TaxID=2708539 RepID=UPI001FE71B75|nr:fumarylacetoacetase [Caulobacter soli]
MSVVIDETHAPDLTSWVASAAGHQHFPIQNLPYGVFAPSGGPERIGVAIGEAILDLTSVGHLLPIQARDLLAEPRLNRLLAAPAATRLELRRAISSLLSRAAHRADVEPHLHAAGDSRMRLPARIGDYTDFYTGIHHATNAGRLFRPDDPLPPNYRWMPIAYHGRASSIRPSGQAVVRPTIQRGGSGGPAVGPSRGLDYEMEIGVWIGEGSALGAPIPIAQAGGHIAGLCLLNDWSARDAQAWEAQPLGPFLAKNFQTSISPWIVTAEALAPFRTAQPPRSEGEPSPLPYLFDSADQTAGAFAIELVVELSSAAMRQAGLPAHLLSRADASNMYWTAAQMIAHHTLGGCDLRSGDLLGTGTISGPTSDSLGCLLEITRGGQAPITLPTGETRAFLSDGDEVVMTAKAQAEGFVTIGFGECRGTVASARAG